MVDYVSDAGELHRRLKMFAFGGAAAAADEDLALKLQTIPGVEADQLTEGAEILYSYRDKLDDDGIRLMAELFTYANEQRWTTFVGGEKGTNNRAERIIKDARKDLGELAGKVKPEDAPEPQLHRRLVDGGAYDWRIAGAPPAPPSPPETVDAPPPPDDDG